MRTSVVLLAICAALASSGCGSSNVSADPNVLRGTSAVFPDYLDPALSQTLEGSSAMWNTYLPLLTYQHAEGRAGTKLIPGLARSLPRLSDGGRTYTLYLRRGLHYSDGEPVRASDFRHSVERLLILNSAGSPFFTDIRGAEHFQRTRRGGIPGIRTNDRSGQITIRLREPRGTFIYELATLYGALLPADTPEEDLSSDPPPGTGPYEIVASRPGRGWEYVRNPEWDSTNAKRLPSLPGGHFDRIEISVLHNPETQVAEVERGGYDWMVNPPPSARIGGLKRRFLGTQLAVAAQIDVFYFWMNTTVPPFDDVRVRRAVNYAIDPRALSRIYGVGMKPSQQILPPAMPGHKTFRPYPQNLAKAEELVAAADPVDRNVTVWTDDYPANLEAAEYYEGVLRELGFQTNLKVLSAANYFTVIGNRSTPNLDTGTGNWFLDYPDPNDYFEPQLTGGGRATGNTNWARFNDPTLDSEVARLRRRQLGPPEEAAYARLDRRFMRQAPWAPFGNLSLATLVGPRIDVKDLIISPIYGQDLTSFRLGR